MVGLLHGGFEDLGCYSTDWDNAASTPLRAYAQPGKMVLANWTVELDQSFPGFLVIKNKATNRVIAVDERGSVIYAGPATDWRWINLTP